MALKMQQQKQQLLKKQQAFRLTKQRVQRRVGTSSHSDAITTSNGNQISLIEAAYQSAADEVSLSSNCFLEIVYYFVYKLYFPSTKKQLNLNNI